MRVDTIVSSKAFEGRRIMGREAIRLIPSSIPTDLERSIERKIDILPTPTVIKKNLLTVKLM